MISHSLLILCFSILTLGQRLEQIFQADPGVALENIAVRSNGRILVTGIGNNALLDVDAGPRGSVSNIATIPGVQAVNGIAEISPEVFAVLGSNLSLAGQPRPPGSAALFTVNLNYVPPIVSKAADGPSDVVFLNGLTAIPRRLNSTANATLLASDTIGGRVFQIDPDAGAIRQVFTDLPGSSNGTGLVTLGVNGLRFVPVTSTLFLSNTIAALFGSIQLTVIPRGSGLPDLIPRRVRTIARNVPIDDFAVRPDGTAFVGLNTNSSLARITPFGRVKTLVGGPNQNDILSPSSAAFGRTAGERNTLFFTTLGTSLSTEQPGNATTPSITGRLFRLEI